MPAQAHHEGGGSGGGEGGGGGGGGGVQPEGFAVAHEGRVEEREEAAPQEAQRGLLHAEGAQHEAPPLGAAAVRQVPHLHPFKKRSSYGRTFVVSAFKKEY